VVSLTGAEDATSVRENSAAAAVKSAADLVTGPTSVYTGDGGHAATLVSLLHHPDDDDHLMWTSSSSSSSLDDSSTSPTFTLSITLITLLRLTATL